MCHINPLHPPVTPDKHSSFSALGDAITGPTQFLSHSRRRLPQALYTPASKWKNATGRSTKLCGPILFSCPGCSLPGAPMRELSSRSAAGIEAVIARGKDEVFSGTGLRRIVLRILWPGYEHVEWARSIDLDAFGSTTRAQLAGLVAINFARFMEVTRSEPARSSEWHLGPSGIRFDSLILVSLTNVFDDVWQADVDVERR